MSEFADPLSVMAQVATKQLLGALVCRQPLTAALLRLESWQLLVQDFALRAEWTKQIASRPERALSKALVTAAQGLSTPQVRQPAPAIGTRPNYLPVSKNRPFFVS